MATIRTGQPDVNDDGHQRGQLPTAHCQTAPPPPAPGGDHGRPSQTERPHPGKGPPDQSSCRGPETRPTAIGKSGCHPATTPAECHASKQIDQRSRQRTTPSIRRTSPRPARRFGTA